MKWTAKDTSLAIAMATGTIFMLGLYGYIGYCSFQVGGWF